MARVVTKNEHQFGEANAEQYPWATWADGQQRHLEPGVDFDGTPEEFEEQVYRHARQTGSLAKTALNDTGIYIQFETREITTQGSASPIARKVRQHSSSNPAIQRTPEEQTELDNAEYSTILPSFDRRGQPKGGYPWDSWTDGKPHRLKYGTHYKRKLENFLVSAYTKARQLGKKVRTTRNQDGVTIQFYTP